MNETPHVTAKDECRAALDDAAARVQELRAMTWGTGRIGSALAFAEAVREARDALGVALLAVLRDAEPEHADPAECALARASMTARGLLQQRAADWWEGLTEAERVRWAERSAAQGGGRQPLAAYAVYSDVKAAEDAQ